MVDGAPAWCAGSLMTAGRKKSTRSTKMMERMKTRISQKMVGA
jgi:hypothetical protein